MIIYEKLLERYSLEQMKVILGNYDFYYNFLNDRVNKLERIAKLISLKDFYTFDDFQKDFGEKYKKHKEIKTIFNILMNGLAVSDFLAFNKNISSQLYNGFIMETIAYSKKQIKYIEIDYDISNFKVSFFDTHIELYGDKDDLDKFKTKYKIEQKILFEPYKEVWHLAFSGLLSEKIKYDLKGA